MGISLCPKQFIWSYIIKTQSLNISIVRHYIFKKISEVKDFFVAGIIEWDALCSGIQLLRLWILASTVICTGGGITSILTGPVSLTGIVFDSISLFTVITQGILNKTGQIYVKETKKDNIFNWWFKHCYMVFQSLFLRLLKMVIHHKMNTKSWLKKNNSIDTETSNLKKTKFIVDNISQEQRKQILNQDWQEGKEAF